MAPSLPHDFLDSLATQFDNRLRIRWSHAKDEWHIEQQVGRAIIPPFRIDINDDRFIRARDGYAFVMAVKPTNYMWCRECHLRLKVPIMRTAEVRCDYCESTKKRARRNFVAYYPLNDTLLQHLHKIDPHKDGHLRAAAEADLAIERAEMQRQRTIRNHIEAATLDDKYQLFSTPFVGYTGKEFTK